MDVPEGVIAALVTPSTPVHQVNFDVLAEIGRFVGACGVDAFMALGTTGEGPILSEDDRRKIVETLTGVSGTPTIAQVGHPSLKSAVRLAEHAIEHGAVAVSALPMFYYTPDDRAIETYYKSLAAAVSPHPIFLYTLPALTHVQLSPDLVGRLANEIENLAGIKDSSGSVTLLAQYVEIFRNRGMVFCGNDRLLLHSLRVGARGYVTSGSGVTPEPYVALWKAGVAGRWEDAARAQGEIDRLVSAFQDGKHPGVFKAGLSVRGFAAGEAFPPLPEVTREDRRQIEEAVARYPKARRPA